MLDPAGGVGAAEGAESQPASNQAPGITPKARTALEKFLRVPIDQFPSPEPKARIRIKIPTSVSRRSYQIQHENRGYPGTFKSRQYVKVAEEYRPSPRLRATHEGTLRNSYTWACRGGLHHQVLIECCYLRTPPRRPLERSPSRYEARKWAKQEASTVNQIHNAVSNYKPARFPVKSTFWLAVNLRLSPTFLSYDFS
jgi:hypothetical protein